MRIANDYVHVRVPASCANLGPGFDCLGLAVDLVDDVEAWAVAGPTTIDIDGYGKDTLPRDDSHLIVETVGYALDAVGAPRVGLKLKCVNRIPHGRGLGSSAAAIVAGLMIARGLIDTGEALSDSVIVDLGGRIEGHADNIAPAAIGGVCMAWSQSDILLDTPRYYARHLNAESLGRVTVCIPQAELLTKTARSVLPEKIDHADAAANSARTAMLVYALEHDASLLFEATRDYLHQSYRYSAMPDSLRLVEQLRSRGLPAVVSGAGPTVLVLDILDGETIEDLENSGWDVRTLAVNHDGANIIK